MKKHYLHIYFSVAFILVLQSILANAERPLHPQEEQLTITADTLYKHLDLFLSDTSPSGMITFRNQLQKLRVETSSPAIQLAKVISLCNLGFFESQSGQLYDAISSYQEAWILYTRNSLTGYDIINSCAIPLGNLYTQTNAFEEAERIIEQYLLRAEQLRDGELVTSGIINLSTLYQSQGNYLKSSRLLQNALQKTPNNPHLLLNLASASYAVGHKNIALQQANSALTIDPTMSNVFKLKALIFTDQGNYKDAEIAINQTIRLLEKNRNAQARDYAKAYLASAEIKLANLIDSPQNNDEFLNTLHSVYKLLIPTYQNHQVLPKKEQLYGENTLLDALEVQARYFEQKGALTNALAVLEHSFLVADQLNHKELLQGSRLSHQSGEKRRCEQYLHLIYNLHQTSKNPSLLIKGLIAVDRIKSKIATDSYFKKQHAQNTSSPRVIIPLKNLEKKQAALNNQLVSMRKSNSSSDRQYLELLQQFEDIRTQLKQAYADLPSDQFPAETPTVDALLKKTLTKKETFVNYFVGKESTFQFVIHQGEIAIHRLSKNEKEQQLFLNNCRSFSQLFINAGAILNDPNHYSTTAYNLYKLLKIPDTEQLVVSPDGILSFIPFDALLTKQDNTLQFNSKPFLIRNTEISFVSATTLYLSQEKPLSISASILGLFPIFNNTDRVLSYSLEEAATIENSFDMESLMYGEATEEAFFSKSDQHSILHLSTHASAGDFKTPASLSFYDKDTPVALFYGQHWSPDLVVLSACETGVGKIINGEGAQSLARGFHYAGAKNILFSQWKVNDRTTATLMGNYYKNLQKSNSRNNSLHTAKLQLLDDSKISDLQKSPYFWASFTYYGTTDIPKEENRNYWLWGLPIIVVFLILLIFKKYAFTSRVSTI